MSKRRITLLLFAGAFFQTLLPANLPLLLCLMLPIALESRRSSAVYAGVLAGILHDAFCPAPFGSSIPFFLLIGWGIQLVREEVFSDQLITYVILGGGTGLFKTLYFSMVYALGGIRHPSAVEMLVRAGAGMLTGALLAPVVFLILSGLRRMLSFKRRHA